jgi:hypothetical protein
MVYSASASVRGTPKVSRGASVQGASCPIPAVPNIIFIFWTKTSQFQLCRTPDPVVLSRQRRKKVCAISSCNTATSHLPHHACRLRTETSCNPPRSEKFGIADQPDLCSSQVGLPRQHHRPSAAHLMWPADNKKGLRVFTHDPGYSLHRGRVYRLRPLNVA